MVEKLQQKQGMTKEEKEQVAAAKKNYKEVIDALNGAGQPKSGCPTLPSSEYHLLVSASG